MAYLPARIMTDIFHVARRLTCPAYAWQAVQDCLDPLEIGTVDRSVPERAPVVSGADSEDTVQFACAERNELEAIVTRDMNDYAGSLSSAWSPRKCRRQLQSKRTVPMQLTYSLKRNRLLS